MNSKDDEGLDDNFTKRTERLTVEIQLTNKYLNGELTFAEYSEKWFGSTTNDDEGDDVDADVDIDVDGDDEPEDDEEEAEKDGDGEGSSGEKVKKTSSSSGVAKKRRRQRRHLPVALVGLMGEANLRCARGDLRTAENICYEIIRQHPTSYEPYQTLAQIFESNPEKSLEFSLIAAHLNSDPNEWLRLADILKKKGDIKQELVCLTRAVQADPKNVNNHILRLERLQYLEKNDLAPAGYITSMHCRIALMNSYPDTEGQTVLNLAKSIARDFHAVNKIHRAAGVINRAYKRFSSLFTYEDLNLYIELLIGLQQFDKCIEIFVAKGGVEVEAELDSSADNGDVQVLRIVNCKIPPSLPIDLRTKLIVCLIHLRAFNLVDSFLNVMIENEDAETTGDIFLDIEEALTAEGLHSESLRLLALLVQSKNFSLPAVWLKYADCLAILNRNDEAIEAYQIVVNRAPQHLRARIKLSALLKQNNRIEEAYMALAQDENAEVLDTSILYERCMILKKKGDKAEFLKVGILLLSRHFYSIRHKSEVATLIVKDTHEHLMELRKARGEPFEDIDAPTFEDNCDLLTLDVEWELLNDILNIAYELKQFATLQRVSFLALASKKFVTYRKNLEFASILASYYNNDSYMAFNLIRNFLVKMPGNVGLWNLFNLILQKSKDVRAYKFLNRFFQRTKTHNKLYDVFIGNYFIGSGSYKHAFKEYRECYNWKPTALTAFTCGLSLIHVASQKFSVNRNQLLAQSIAYFKHYEELRGEDGLQEVYYNLGRAYHQMGLINVACDYYKKALEVTNEFIAANSDVMDLKREIAFNLHLIYKNNCPQLAKMYLYKYIVL